MGALRFVRASSADARLSLPATQLLMETAVGIDLGTTFSVVAVCQGGKVSVIQASAARNACASLLRRY